MKIARAELTSYRLPERRPIRGHTHREGWHLTVHTTEGRVGVGEATTWPGFGAEPALVARGLEEACAALTKLELRELEEIQTWVTRRAPTSEVACAVECALLDLLAQERELPLARVLSPTASLRVSSHALVDDLQSAQAAMGRGFTTLKIKRSAPSEELAQLAALGAVLRVDANGTLTPSAAARLAASIPHLAWLEQPCAPRDLAGMREVRETTGVTVAADESVRDLASLRAVLEARAADAVVLKPMFNGGLLATMALASEARRAGVWVVITHALGSAVDRAAAIHAACALGVSTPCGLGSHLARDVAHLDDGPEIEAPRLGLGVRLGGVA